MSNRNFDSRVIIQRLQDKNYARNFYQYNTSGQRILHNPQNSNSGALQYTTYHDGSQTMYFRGLIGGGMTVDTGGIFGIPPYPGFGVSGGSVAPVITVPSAPSISSIISGNQQLTVSFLAPISDGGSVITDYQYSTNINAFSSIGATVAPFIITGLTNGTTYDVALRAVNSVGAGPNATGTGTPITTPSAPIISSILPGNQQLTVSFLAPLSDGGSIITDYQYSTNINAFSSIGSTVTPFIITGLTNGTTYDVALRAVNAVGAGPNATGTGTPSTSGSISTSWAVNIGSVSADFGYGIITDLNNNVITVGQYGASAFINSFYSISSNGIISTTSTLTLPAPGPFDAYIVKYTSSGTALWGTNISGSSTDGARSVTTAASGDIYVTGIFTNSSFVNSFNSIVGSTISTTSYGRLLGASATNTDIFIAKYTSSGVAQWATNIGGAGGDTGYGITTDLNNNIYVVGSHAGNAILPLANINSFSTVSSGVIITSTFGSISSLSGTSVSPIIAKYNSSGIAQWATNIPATGTSQANGVATDIFGNVYVTGTLATTPIINSFSTVSSGRIITNIFGRFTALGGGDAFVAKYNSSGIVQWATNIATVSPESGQSIATDIFGNIYMTGYYTNSSFINSYVSVSTNSSISTSLFGKIEGTSLNDAMIVKYNSSGTVLWATNIAGTSADQGLGIVTDAIGNVYTTGRFGSAATTSTFVNSYNSLVGSTISTTTFGRLISNGGQDAFIAKYNSSGIAQWATNFGGTSSGIDDIGYNITLDTLGNIYVSGSFISPSTFINSYITVSSGTISTSRTAQLLGGYGGIDALVVKYNSDGQFVI